MSSKKEEERNEKVIRGLMKLPPNRRCINCNSLGPQYVCTNFWTFICITCSGIHREFTHRVKSVSMAKFTSQEVELLQRGGNQRAREIFLKDWDLQRQRLPSGSVEKVREFIKHVYVDRKYAGGNTSEKPPRDVQTLRNLEDDTRRASSYHSYSQSPPYEHQYEDRKYGKVLTRRPGSDRGHYEGKLSSFYSPGRLGEQMYEDRFANEGSGSRASDYSVSSGGDPFRSDYLSPNSQKDIRGSSPPVLPVRDILAEDAKQRNLSTYSVASVKRDADRTAHPQRSASLSNFGSIDSNSVSLKSVHSGGFFDVGSEQSTRTQLDRMSNVPSLPQSHVSSNNVNVNSFNSSLIQQSATFSVPSIDFFQPQATSSTPPIDLFTAISHHQIATSSFEQKQPALSFVNNGGWATFDLPHHEISVPESRNVPPTSMTLVDAFPFGKFDAPSINASMQSPSVQSSTAHGPFSSSDYQWHGDGGLRELQAPAGTTSTKSWNAFEDSPVKVPQASIATPSHKNEAQVLAYKLPSIQSSTHGPFSSPNNQWHGGSHEVQAPTGTTITESWNAFEDSPGSLPQDSIASSSYKTEAQVPAYQLLSNDDQHLSLKISEDTDKDSVQRASQEDRPPVPNSSINDVISGSSFTPPLFSFMGEMPAHASDQRSTNPFDLPYEAGFEPNDMFLDMSSLQSALPDTQFQPSFVSGLSEPWLLQRSVTPYVPATPQGGLSYMAGEIPGPQLPNIPSSGPVASLGGNPFA